MIEILMLLVPLAAAWFWLDSVKARDIAVTAARRACTREGVQLLDETVAGRRLRLKRDEAGQMRFHREFHFEFSDTGDNRRPGVIILLGQRVELVSLASLLSAD